MDYITTLLPLAILIVLMYFLMIKPQKKREKEAQEMRNGVQPGDEIITIGGICGKVVKTKEETVTIQVGADKMRFDIMRWAISKVVSTGDRKKAAAASVTEDEPKKAMPKRLKKSEQTEEPASPVAEPQTELE